MDEREICKAALDLWGAQAQLFVLFEEMGELMQAVGKLERVMPCDAETELPELLAHAAEEVADVEIMLAQIKILYGIEDAAADWKDRKLRRLKGREETAMRTRGEGAGGNGV